MIFLISLCIALLFVTSCSKALIKNPVPFYIGATIIALLSIVVTWSKIEIPFLLKEYILPIIGRGGFTGALFVIVMYAGAFPSRSLGVKIFMPVRGQISIIASIIGIGHAITYSKPYISLVANNKGNMNSVTVAFIADSILLSLVMLPLFITSFISVRRKMSGVAWKKLQRLAYLFYLLLFIHVMLLMIPGALDKKAGYELTVFVYIFIFVSYFACRIVKALNINNAEIIPKKQITAIACALFVATLLVSIITNTSVVSATANTNTAKNNENISNEAEDNIGLNDGVFHGEGMGNNGNIEVDVTIEAGRITDIVFTKFIDDKEFFDVEIDGKTMIDKVIKEQSCEVDGISGATYSSKGFLEAVENALEKARN